MASMETAEQTVPKTAWATSLFRGLASLQLGVILMVALAVVMMVATGFEKDYGHEYTLWYVYRRPWFLALVGLLAVNMLAAMLRRYPWGRAEWGSLLAHGGVLVVLFGAVQTYFYGVEGSLIFSPGESRSEFFVPDRCRLTVARKNSPGGTDSAASSFVFAPGPVSWPEGQSLSLGYADGVGVTVLRYLPHAELREKWSADPTGRGRPAVEFGLLNPRGEIARTGWLEVEHFTHKVGETISMGDRVRLKILQYLPSARHEVAFVPADVSSGDPEPPEAAVLVEVDAGDDAQQVWLCRNDPDYGAQVIATPDGPLRLSFGYERLPLEFKLTLLDCRREKNPGGVGDAAYSSTVQLIDRAADLDVQRKIFMNHPLVYKNYIIFQSSLPPGGTPLSVLGVTYDPGRWAKHVGCVLVGVGLVLMFFARKRARKPQSLEAARDVSPGRSTAQPWGKDPHIEQQIL
ncbi:MAG: hypothetical protein JXB10_18540 [Pirellulales bacterium]|nr:hypothetical protein [Pirellulales bacterium]